VIETFNFLFSNPGTFVTGSKKGLAGRILILSGKGGEILQWMETPDKAESYYSPQILTGTDGADSVLLGTGGETHPGSLYVIPLHDITSGHTKNVREIPSTFRHFPFCFHPYSQYAS